MSKEKKDIVLVCPLEWGLGHASRCVPVIKELLNNNFTVVIGTTPFYQKYFLTLFPELDYIRFPSFKIKYGRNAFFSIMLQVPKFLFQIYYEHYYLSRIVKKNNYSLIISDNRYGLWNKKIKSIIISHQIFIKLPKYLNTFEGIFNFFTSRALKKFDECWIPDLNDTGNCYSGVMSHGKIPGNCRYIGLLSRFNYCLTDNFELKNQVLVILSGPEPQRTIFEKTILNSGIDSGYKIVVLRGRPGLNNEEYIKDNYVLINHVDDKAFFKMISESKYIISRAGYSTIMDLVSTGKTAVLIATPGQTEQEYLAEYLGKKGRFISLKQKNFNLKSAIRLLNDNDKKFARIDNKILKSIINDMRTLNE